MTYFILDKQNYFEVSGPTNIAVGDTLIVKCGASKYNYLNDIKWIYPEYNQTQQSEYIF